MNTKKELKLLLESKKQEITSIQQTLHNKYGVDILVVIHNECRTKRGENVKIQAIKAYQNGYGCSLRKAADSIVAASLKPTPVRQEVVNKWIKIGMEIELVED